VFARVWRRCGHDAVLRKGPTLICGELAGSSDIPGRTVPPQCGLASSDYQLMIAHYGDDVGCPPRPQAYRLYLENSGTGNSAALKAEMMTVQQGFDEDLGIFSELLKPNHAVSPSMMEDCALSDKFADENCRR